MQYLFILSVFFSHVHLCHHSTHAVLAVSRYTSMCPSAQNPWSSTGIASLGVLVATEELVGSAEPVVLLPCWHTCSELASLGLRFSGRPLLEACACTKHNGRGLHTGNNKSVDGANTLRHGRMASLGSFDQSLTAPDEASKHRLRHAGPDFRPGAAHFAELVWRITEDARTSSRCSASKAWQVLVPIVRTAVLTRRRWSSAALFTLSDALFEAGRIRQALHFGAIASRDSSAEGQQWIPACDVTLAAAKLCLGAEYEACTKAAYIAFRKGIKLPERKAKARFCIASMHLWGGDGDAAMAEVRVDMDDTYACTNMNSLCCGCNHYPPLPSSSSKALLAISNVMYFTALDAAI